ncbi:hypothetical protein [Aneurinibacillus terranovensis]|uniref:hypothetical protein n=1 Tax=Aneurinibacillus terranovensis TaxID=278991 RepID=UPI000424E10A|nr:hypothetical protein [Aneurinibacillus terranovensis]
MKVLSTLWGLLVDDGRLAFILLLSLLIAGGLSLAHQSFMAAIVIWLGLMVSLWVSIMYQLQSKLSK